MLVIDPLIWTLGHVSRPCMFVIDPLICTLGHVPCMFVIEELLCVVINFTLTIKQTDEVPNMIVIPEQ